MPKTISFHNGTSWSRGHNIRDTRYVAKQEHINPQLSENNVVLCDTPVRQAYKDIFGQAVEEYNAHQKRADRRIEDYYDKIKADKRKNPVYEVIVQIGDYKDTGNNAVLEKQALERFAREWNERNPNLRLIGAYIHADEPDGTVHAHLDYIPVAECSRGMKIQNSLDRALRQQGFKSENIHQTAQIEWQDREREALCVICRELNIDVQRSQGVGQGREYLTPQEYKREKRKQEEIIREELKPLQSELESYKSLQTNVNDFALEKKKIPFAKRVSVSVSDLEQIEEQAKAYRANRDKIISLQSDQECLETKAEQLIKEQERLEKERAELSALQEQTELAYQQQLHLNRILEQTKDELSEEKENNSQMKEINSYLVSEVKEQREIIRELEKQLEMKQETVRGAYESLANVTKAVGMLKYDTHEYRASLTTAQYRLIDAIANYSAEWADRDGFHDIAQSIRQEVGISKGIKDEIEELTPKKYISHENERSL